MVTTLPSALLGRTNLRVSTIGFGALEIGRDWGLGDDNARSRPDEGQTGATLNEVLDLGVNLIDTARAYHRSEERIGKFAAGRRSEYVLASKCGEHSSEPNTYYDFAYQAVSDSIDLSLRLLCTDHLDLIQIHFGPDPESVLDSGETVRAMRDAQQSGKVRFLGASPPRHLIDRCVTSGDFDVVQVAFSLLDQGASDSIARAANSGVGVLIRSGLGAGWLTPKACAEPEEKRPEKVIKLLELTKGDGRLLHALALHHVVSTPGVSSILVGSKHASHVKECIDLLSTPIDADMLEQARFVGR